jgi:hypothetical protein
VQKGAVEGKLAGFVVLREGIELRSRKLELLVKCWGEFMNLGRGVVCKKVVCNFFTV